jgi:sec-independent protein translocase protein TatC
MATADRIKKLKAQTPEYPDDVFEHTRMPIGEHIEELRYRLFNALKALGLVLLFCVLTDTVGISMDDRSIGVGVPMLDFMTTPVTEQTRDFYYRIAEKNANQKLASLTNSTPEEIAAIRKKLKDNDDSLSALSTEEKKKLLGAREIMPVFLPKKALEEVFGPAKPGTPDEVQVPLGVYPGYISYLNSKGEGLLEAKNYITTLSAQEAMVVWFKVSLLCGIVLASPIILYQFWAFVGAGLYPHEKRYIYLFFGPSLVLFVGGILLCQFVVLPGAVKALLKFNEILGLDPDIRMTEWLGLAIILPLVFGVSFQTPLVMVFLNRIGLFSAGDYLTKWRHALFFLALFSAIITPTPDVITLLYLLVPMFGLYMLGIAICHYFPGFDPNEGDEGAEEVAV